ncbi:MAG: hypothetical protein R2811_03450 [Flavobacteriales bacterium]
MTHRIVIDRDDEEESPEGWHLDKPIPTGVEDMGRNLIRFSYYDCLVNDNDCSFCHDQRSIEEYQGYFKAVGELSRMTYEEFTDLPHKDYHVLVRFPSKPFEQKMFADWTGFDFRQPHSTPSIGQFAVFPKTGKPHRVHFYVGPSGVLFIVAFDAKHSMRPTAGNA